MNVLRFYGQSSTLVLLLAFFSLNAQAISVVNNFTSGPDTDILCRNNDHSSLVQNCWTAGTGAGNNNYKISAQGKPTPDELFDRAVAPGAFGEELDGLSELYKVKSFDDPDLSIRSTPARESGTLQNSYATAFDFVLNDIGDGYTGATISHSGGFAADCSVDCFLVVTGGKNNPAAYLFNLALGWDPNSTLGDGNGWAVNNGTPSWNGLRDLSLANFWNGENGSIGYIAIYGKVTASAVPVPATLWLFSTALLGFIGLSRRTQG